MSDKQGECKMLIIDRNIVTVGRKWRSKWWSVSCTCRPYERRKDGTCKHEHFVLANMHPEIQCRAKIEVKDA